MRVLTASEFLTGIPDPASGPALTPADLEQIEADDRYLQTLLKAHRVPARTTGGRFGFLSSADFVKRARMRWIVSGVLPEAELAVIYGESGSGKSFLAYDMAASISRGIEWNGHKTVKGNVAIIAAEGAAGMRNRVEAYQLQNFCEHAELPAVMPDSPNFMDNEHAALVAKQLLASGPFAVVIVDTLSNVHQGNENSGDDMGKVLANCKFLHRKTGALIVLIHHSGKDATKGARGWSGIRAAADAEIEVKRNKETRLWSVSKMKDGEDGQAFGFNLERVPLGTDDDGNTISSCVVNHCAIAQPVSQGNRPSGKYEEAIYAAVRLTPDGADTAKLRAKILDAIPHIGEGRDQRKGSFNTALQSLCHKRLLRTVEGTDGTRVAMALKHLTEEAFPG